MASEVSICNQALGWLGVDRITSLDDDVVEAELCKENYPDLRDAVLEEGAFSFSKVRLVPAAESTAPAFKWAFSFLMPSTVLRVLEVYDNPDIEYGESTLEWEVENGRVLTDSEIIYVRAIQQITDPKKFSPLFVQALAARLAADLAIPLTKSRTLQADMWSLYQNKMQEAMGVDGSQGRRRRTRQLHYHRVR